MGKHLPELALKFLDFSIGQIKPRKLRGVADIKLVIHSGRGMERKAGAGGSAMCDEDAVSLMAWKLRNSRLASAHETKHDEGID